MARSKRSTEPQPPPTAPDNLEDAVVELAAEVRALAQIVEVLRIAVDDLREELQFAIRNLPREPWVPSPPLTSMAKNPLADDFPVNRTRREDLPTDRPDAPPHVAPPAPAPTTRASMDELF